MPKNLMQLPLNSIFNLYSICGVSWILVMDMPIFLKCTTMALQKLFLGVIPDDVLAMVYKEDAQCLFIHDALSWSLAMNS